VVDFTNSFVLTSKVLRSASWVFLQPSNAQSQSTLFCRNVL